MSKYLSPLLVGPKLTIFGFFITVLLYITINKNKYKMIDEEDNLIPSVFAKISSKMFSFFGFIELFIILFFPHFSAYGIGSNYLLILCSPIKILYDYKKKYELNVKYCKKINFAKFINFFVLIIFYGIIFILGLIDIISILGLLAEYIQPIINLIIDNFQYIMQIIDIYYNLSFQ